MRRGGRREIGRVSSPPSGPGPGRRVAGRAEPADRRRPTSSTTSGWDARPPGHDRRGVLDETPARHGAASGGAVPTRRGCCCRPGVECPGAGLRACRTSPYSVPARYAGHFGLPVRLSANSVEVLDGPQVVARHERVAGKISPADPDPGPLPGDPAAQGRARCPRPTLRWPNPNGQRVQARPCAVLGRHPPPARRCGGDRGADRGAARAPHPARCAAVEAAMTRAISSACWMPRP